MNNDIKNILVTPKTSIKQTLDVIDKGVKQIALVVDEDNELLGTVTDGDIRRAILNGIELDNPVEKVMNKDYISLSYQSTIKEKKKVFKSEKINQIPLVDKDNR